MKLFGSLKQTLTASMLALAVLSIGLVGLLWIIQEYNKIEAESDRLKTDYLDSRKALIKQEVDRVVDYIQYQRSTTENSLQSGVKNQVDNACALAGNLYSRFQGQKSDADIKDLIREALRPIRISNGLGSFFICDMQGNILLMPSTPQLEGRNLWDLQDSKGQYTVRRIIALIKEKGEGFLRWEWSRPGENGTMNEEIGFSKRFAPYDWIIGTGEYLKDAEREIQQQTLAWINTIRFGEDGYVFVYDFAANTLAHYKPGNIGLNQWEFRDPNGIPVLQELIKRSQQQNGTFLEYVSTIRPLTGQPAEKIAYARAFPEWGWMIGSGVYYDEINNKLAEKRAVFLSRIRWNFGMISLILLASLVVVAVFSRYVSVKIASNIHQFKAFFDRSARDSGLIDQQQLHFSEFKELAQAANAMVEERNRASAAIEDLQQQLLRSRKMEALGVLAGGVAHDLNNVLSAIVGYPDLILASLPAESSQRRYIEAIRESGIRASEIVQDLLTLARRGVIQPTVLDLNALIRQYMATPEYIKLCTVHPEVKVETRLAADLLCISGSLVHLQKTLMNLIVNAAEAQPRGGTIRIVTENRYLEQPLRGYDRIREGQYVHLSIADEGIGISESDLNHIFEPFFSKKKLGRSGTGLGMAVVWGTVQDHHGYVTVTTAENQGTLFELYFPSTGEMAAEEGDGENLADYQGSGQSILLVDDVEEQRKMAGAMLQWLGYRIVSVASGEEALAYLAGNQADLLLLDMIMLPGMDGLETYEKALALNPQQAAILVSGYAETDRVQAAMELGARRYVKKPYTIQTLAKAVWEALHT